MKPRARRIAYGTAFLVGCLIGLPLGLNLPLPPGPEEIIKQRTLEITLNLQDLYRDLPKEPDADGNRR